MRRPALKMTAAGRIASTNAGELLPALPWCGALTMTIGGGAKPRDHVGLDGPGDVTRQDERDVADPDVEHDRVVVADLLPLPVGLRRIEDGERRGAGGQRLAGAALDPGNPGARGGGAQPPQRLVARNRDAVPDFGRRQRAEDRGRAADVIGIAVRQHERPEPSARRTPTTPAA